MVQRALCPLFWVRNCFIFSISNVSKMFRSRDRLGVQGAKEEEMSHTTYTFNRYHLGDNLIFLHLLRALAKQRVSQPFVHFCHAHLIPQLQEAVVDLPNILLEPFESRLWEDRGPEAVDTWKNAEGIWERSDLRWDWAEFQLMHHRMMALRMAFKSPFTCREHLLADWPCLETFDEGFHCDFLIGDSAPSSGQYSEWADHSKVPMQKLIEVLSEKHSVVLTSDLKKSGLTVCAIGKQSKLCRHHIMVANAPFFCTMNVHNHHYHEGRRRIVLLDNGEVLGMPHIEQVSNVESVFTIAKEAGWI